MQAPPPPFSGAQHGVAWLAPLLDAVPARLLGGFITELSDRVLPPSAAATVLRALAESEEAEGGEGEGEGGGEEGEEEEEGGEE